MCLCKMTKDLSFFPLLLIFIMFFSSVFPWTSWRDLKPRVRWLTGLSSCWRTGSFGQVWSLCFLTAPHLSFQHTLHTRSEWILMTWPEQIKLKTGIEAWWKHFFWTKRNQVIFIHQLFIVCVIYLISEDFGILVLQLIHLVTCDTYGADLCTSRTWWRELWATCCLEFNQQLASTFSRCPTPAMWMMCRFLATVMNYACAKKTTSTGLKVVREKVCSLNYYFETFNC